jgi:hypothetical protein
MRACPGYVGAHPLNEPVHFTGGKKNNPVEARIELPSLWAAVCKQQQFGSALNGRGTDGGNSEV